MNVPGRRGLTLRIKAVLVVGLSVATMVALLHLTLSSVLLREYRALEEREMRVDMNRVTDALQHAIAELHSKSGDWADRDETYEYMVTRDPAFIRSNLNIVALQTMSLHLIALVFPTLPW